jgi:L-iditol 2-dehydrogenase
VFAAVLHGREDLRVEEIVPAPLRTGEVRVRIGAALTCGTDLKVYRRGYHARMLVPPCVFGHELAGTIVESRAESPEFPVGTRVVAANSAPCGACPSCRRGQENLCDDLLFLNGAYAESIVVPARLVRRNLLRIAPETAFADAALTEPLACVVQGIDDLRLAAGESVLVLGSGPIGLMAAVLARHAGCHVAVVGRGAERLAKARAIAAHEAIANEAAEGIASPLLAGRQFDAVFEAVGKPSVWEASIDWVRKGGRVNLFGGCPAGTTVKFDTTRLHYSNLSLLASFHHTPRTIRRALSLIEAGVVRSADFVDGRATLADLPEVFRAMAAGNRAVKTLVET